MEDGMGAVVLETIFLASRLSVFNFLDFLFLDPLWAYPVRSSMFTTKVNTLGNSSISITKMFGGSTPGTYCFVSAVRLVVTICLASEAMQRVGNVIVDSNTRECKRENKIQLMRSPFANKKENGAHTNEM